MPDGGDRLEPFGLGWRAVLANRTIRVTVRRLRRQGGNLQGYIDVEYKLPGCPKERLSGEVVNLSNGKGRTEFANRLRERKPGIEWRNIIDAFCVQVEQREDDQEPPVWIGNLPPPINGGWLVEGLLERNQTSEIHGDGSVGKSWLALALAVSVTTGVEILPGYRPHLRGNVLYLDYETDHDTLNARVRQIARGAGIDSPNVLYLRMDTPFADNVERLMAICQEQSIVLVIIDSVEAAMAGSTAPGAGSNEGPSKINRGLRRLGRTAFLVDHISAEQGQDKGVATKAYGSIFKRNWVRSAFQLKQTKDAAADGANHLGLFCTKRNNGRLYDPVGIRWEINDELTAWSREEIDDPELEQSLSTVDRIAAYLRREGPSQPSAIAEGASLSSGVVRTTLSRRSDRFERNGHGLWTNVVAGEYREPEDLP